MSRLSSPNATDMTQGHSLPLFVKFSIPILLGNIFQQLYTVVDGIVVGKSISSEALAAVGVSFPVAYLLISLFLGIGTGTSILVSQAFGEKGIEAVGDTIETAHSIMLKSFIPMTLFGLITSRPFLVLLQTDPEILQDALLYLRIYYVGLLAQFGYNIGSGALQAMGDSKTPLYILIFSSILHIILAVLFVPVLKWGVAGIAWSTVISQYFSWFLTLYYMNKFHPMTLGSFLRSRSSKPIYRSIIRLGLPISLQNILYSIGMMVMQPLINLHGTIFVAGYNAAIRVDGFVFMPVTSLTTAITTFVGQNFGAGKIERLNDGIKTFFKFSVLVSIGLAVLVIPFRSSLMGMFTNDPLVVDAGNAYLVRVIPLYFISTLQYMLIGILRGVGYSFIPTVATLASLWLARVPAAFLLTRFFGPDNMHWCYPIGWLIGIAILLPYFLKVRQSDYSIRQDGRTFA